MLDVRPLLRQERQELLTLLDSLTESQWRSPTRVRGWSVKNLALHLLDDDLGWLSRDRDDDRSGLLDAHAADFVGALNRKNARWLAGADQLSRRVVVGLLDWSGREVDAFYGARSLTGSGRVGWASDGPVPAWFDLAQDLTERWVHQLQIREALDRVETYRDDYLDVVMGTFVWAFPHQYRAPARQGTAVRLDLGGTAWTLISDGARWELRSAGPDLAYAAEVVADRDACWRWLTGDDPVPGTLRASGSPDLLEPLLQVRGVLV